MKILDASVVLKWFVEENGSDKAQEILDGHIRKTSEIVVPDLLIYEVGNALKYSGGFTPQEIRKIFAALWNLDLLIVAPQTNIINSAIVLSFSLGLSFYDAAYVALAQEMDMTMITADKALFDKTATLKFIELL